MITFYVPALNSEKTLKNCLESILAINRNIVIVDSGSKDNTLKIAKRYRIKVLKSRNLADGRNVALSNCKTKYIVFIDSDVSISKSWLKNILSCMDRDAAGICGNLTEKNNKDLADRWRAFHLPQNWGENFISPRFLFGSNSLYLAEALRDVGGFDERYATNYEDVDVSTRLQMKNWKIKYCPKAKCFHLKKDNILSVLKMARKWSFHSYKLPDMLSSLILRLFIFNFHYFFKLLKKDILNFKFQNLAVTLFIPAYFACYDISYFAKLK